MVPAVRVRLFEGIAWVLISLHSMTVVMTHFTCSPLPRGGHSVGAGSGDVCVCPMAGLRDRFARVPVVWPFGPCVVEFDWDEPSWLGSSFSAL